MTTRGRCGWAVGEAMRHYHDHEWGTPSYDDGHLFEMLILEGAQAGLSWSTILAKRANFRRAFAGFDPLRLARFGSREQERLMEDAGIIRNRLKIEAAITNARAAIAVAEEYGSLSQYLWQLAGGEPVQNAWASMAEVPAQTETSRMMSRALKRDGFSFVGPTICYAFMQAVGMVNDHLVDCFRHADLAGGSR